MAKSGYTRVRPGVARVQSLIPEDLAQRLADTASRSGKTISAVVHEAIDALLRDVSVLPSRRAGRPPRRRYQTRLAPTA